MNGGNNHEPEKRNPKHAKVTHDHWYRAVRNLDPDPDRKLHADRQEHDQQGRRSQYWRTDALDRIDRLDVSRY